jgi:hypothetical protein
MDTVVTGMKLAGDRPTPDNTLVRIENPGIPGQVRAHVKLPWQKEWKDLGLLKLVGTELVLPLKLAFFCHAKEDKIKVQEIGSRLLEDGFLTWYDDKDLLPGDDWEQVIEGEIEGCDYFLAFLSSQSVKKAGYVNRELRYALEQRERKPFRHRFIIPILLDECTPPRELKSIHFIRMWEPGSYEKLLKALQERKI